MTTVAAPRRDWLFGPAPDILFGCGVAWIALFLSRALIGPQVAAGISGALLVMAFAVPHYGATLVLVYESAETRRKYVLFAVYASLLIALLFAFSLRSALLGSIVLTVYLTWSPWHYTGQNYGIFLTLLGRRGSRPTPALKRWIYASFIFSFLLTFLSIHGAARGSYAPLSYNGTIFRMMPLGIPQAISSFLLIGTLALYLVCTAMAIVGLLRQNSLRALVPSLTLMLTQSLWFAVPAFIRQWKLYTGDVSPSELYGLYSYIWIAAAHSIQYLWICTYYYAGAAAPGKALAYLGKSYLAGYAIWILPGVFFAPALLGSIPAETGLTVMVAATVNLHHFVIDGAIWKLRDGRIARMLFRGDKTVEMPRAIDTLSPLGAFARRYGFALLIGVAGVAAFSVVAINHVEEEYGFRQALERGDLVRAETALARLKWIGNDSPRRHTQIGRRYAREGELGLAYSQFQTSLGLHPTPEAWRSMAQLHEQQKNWQEAVAAYNASFSLDPAHVPSLIGGGQLWIRLGRSDLALPWLERAASLEPANREVQMSLTRARRETGAD